MSDRRGDWEAQLAAYLAEAHDRPHAYGRHDCMTFVAGAIEAVTGKDFAKGHRGKYKSAATAARHLKSLGYASPAEMIAAHLEEKPIGYAQRGDIVLDGEGIPGVVIGGEALFVGCEEGREGLVRQPRKAWAKAWAV